MSHRRPGLCAAHNCRPRLQSFAHATLVMCLLALGAASRLEAGEIVIEQGDKGTEIFVDSSTGERFVPRGANYIRMVDVEEEGGGGGEENQGPRQRNGTFETDAWDPAEAARALRLMQRLGYNTVRVFISVDGPTAIGDHSDGEGLNAAYVENVVEFMELCVEHEIYAIFTHDWLPDVEPWGTLLNVGDGGSDGYCDPGYSNFNRIYMTPCGVLASQEFWRSFIEELTALEAPMEQIFAYAIQNEMFFSTNEYPFTTGVPTQTVAGVYDMGDHAQYTQAREDNMLVFLWHNQDAIKRADPTALVTCGFFAQAPLDPRRIDVPPVVNSPEVLDFVDVHIYPFNLRFSMASYASSFGFDSSTVKPVVMGEFGAYRNNFGLFGWRHGDNVDAAHTLVDWQIDSTTLGVDGWLLWTWDTPDDGHVYSAVGDSRFRDEGVDISAGIPARPGCFFASAMADPARDIIGHIALFLAPAVRPPDVFVCTH